MKGKELDPEQYDIWSDVSLDVWQLGNVTLP